MNSEERDLISHFIARVGGGVGAQKALPPIDPEANRFIAENFKRYPDAPYRITQLAVVEEAALTQAQNRIRDLEFQLQQARAQNVQLQGQLQQVQSGQAQGAQGAHQGGGFFSNLFGRGGQQVSPTQQTVQPRGAMPPGWGPGAAAGARPAGYSGGNYAAGPQPGMFPRSGSGFLGSALSTAAGVAGGVMAANALEGLFSGGHHAAGATPDAAGGAAVPDSGSLFGAGAGADAGAASGSDASDPFGGAGTSAGGFTQQDFGGSDAPTQDDQNFGSTDYGDGGGQDFGGGDDGGGYDDSMF